MKHHTNNFENIFFIFGLGKSNSDNFDQNGPSYIFRVIRNYYMYNRLLSKFVILALIEKPSILTTIKNNLNTL